jgi:hypothetical protein
MSDQSNEKEIVEGLVKKAGQYGMPTMVLTAALAKARYESVADKANQGTTDNGRLIKLQASEYSVLAKVDPFARVTQSDAIGSLYHESTHSYLWKIQSPDATLAYQAANFYYSRVPLGDGSRLSSAADLDYFVDEVAAEYTESRMQSWWAAFNAIDLAISTIAKVGREHALTQILKAREVYERDSRALLTQAGLFGYIFRGLIFKDVVRSPLPILPDFAQWLDGTILEGKVKRHFDQDLAFKKLISNAGFPPLPPYEPPPPAVRDDTVPARMPRWQTIPKAKPPEKLQPGRGTRKYGLLQDQWYRDNQLRQQQLQNDQQRRNRETLQQQQDLRNRSHEQQRETLRRQQEQQRREREEIQRRHDAAAHTGHRYTPGHNPFGGAHTMGGIKHGGAHGAGIPPYGPVHHPANLHIHHPEHRHPFHNPTNPFGVGGMNGTWQVAVQNNAGAWWRGPLNRF